VHEVLGRIWGPHVPLGKRTERVAVTPKKGLERRVTTTPDPTRKVLILRVA